jgi:hypothetical protein
MGHRGGDALQRWRSQGFGGMQRHRAARSARTIAVLEEASIMSKRAMGWVYAGKYERRATLQKRRLEALVDAKVAAELKKLHLSNPRNCSASCEYSEENDMSKTGGW